MRQAMLTFQTEDKTLTFKVKADWNEEAFNLTILADDAWYTQVSEDDIRKLADERNQKPEEYYATLKEFLSNVNPNVLFNLIYLSNEGDVGEAEFTISKKGENNRVLLVFKTNLKKVDFHESIYKILDDLTEKHNELYNYTKTLQKEKDDLEKEKNVFEDKLIEFIERKSKWEQEMYSNFLLILNEKKKRIRFLTNILKRKNIDPNQLPMETELHLSLNKKSKNLNSNEQVSDSESSNYNTDSDDSNETTHSPKPDTERHEPTPSSSRLDLSVHEIGDGNRNISIPKRVKGIDNSDYVAVTTNIEETNEKEIEDEVLTPELEFSTQDLCKWL